jgi:hypothetical protein
VVMKESLARSRFVMRLNGFSSTLRRRDLWRASDLLVDKVELCKTYELTFFLLI